MKLHHTDKPWITPSIKQLFKDRQKAFHRGDISNSGTVTTEVQRVIRNKTEEGNVL
jgi:hypothetical protein